MVEVSLLLPPNSEGPPDILQFGADNTSRVTVARPTTPGGLDGFSETRHFGPIVLETEEFGFRDVGCNVDYKRHMIGRTASQGRESGIWQGTVPIQVDERSVKTFQSRGGSFVGPCELPVNQRQFDQTHAIDAVVEGLGLRGVEISVIFLMRKSNHIKVSKENPGGFRGNRN